MKVVIVKSPKILSGFLRVVFGIKKDKEWYKFCLGYRFAITFFCCIFNFYVV